MTPRSLLLFVCLGGCTVDIPHGLWKQDARADAPRADARHDVPGLDQRIGEPVFADRRLGDWTVTLDQPRDRSVLDQKLLDASLADRKPVDRSLADQKLSDRPPPAPDVKPAPDQPPLTPIDSTSPLVAASSGGYGVAWIDTVAGTPAVLFRMLDGTGAPLTGPVQVSTGPVQNLTSMIWNGLDFVIVYSESSGLMRARLLESGALVTIKQFTTAPIAWAQIVQSTTYGLVYRQATQVLFQKLDPQCNKNGAPDIVYTALSPTYTAVGSYRSPMVAYGDGYYGIAFALESGPTAGAQGPLHFARVDPMGTVVGSVQQLQAGPVLYPSIGHGAGHFTVTWHASGGPALLRINATTGAVVGAPSLLGGDSCCDHAPIVAAGTAGLVEVWTATAGSYGVGFVRLDPASGAKLAGPQVVLSRAGLEHPWIAARGGDYGLVWADTTLGSHEIFFSRLASTATPAGAPLRVSP